MNVFFHSVGNFIIPTDFHSIFQRGRAQPPTRNGFIKQRSHHWAPSFKIHQESSTAVPGGSD